MFEEKMTGFTRAAVAAVLLAVALFIPAPAQAQINIVPNGTVEKVDPSNSAMPMYWEYNKWGGATNAAFVWLPNSTTGNHTLHTQVFSGTDTLPCTYGDAKWWTKAFSIYPGGGAYTFSNSYRGTVNSQVMIMATLSSGGTMYVWVADLKPSSTWATVTKTISLPVATTKIRIMHKICSVGWLETDNYALYKGSSTGKDAGTSPDTVWPPPLGDAGITPGSDATVPTTGAVISVAFDDGWLSVHKNALSIMKKQDIRATHFIHADYVDKKGYQADYMSSTQLKDFHNAGHEMGSHAWDKEWADKDEYLNAATLDAQLQKSLNKLKGFGFDVKGFAPPGGEGIDNAAVIKKVAQYYKYQRTIVEGMNTAPYQPLRLVTQTVLSTTSLATLQGWVASAKQQNAWLILLYHRITTPAKYTTEVTPLNFIDQMGVLKASGMPLKPIGEVLGIWKPYNTGKTDAGSSTNDSGSTTVSDLGGTPWTDFYTPPVPSADGGFIPGRDVSTYDQGNYSMPRPWPLDDDGLCSVTPTTPADALPGIGILMLLSLAFLRRGRF